MPISGTRQKNGRATRYTKSEHNDVDRYGGRRARAPQEVCETRRSLAQKLATAQQAGTLCLSFALKPLSRTRPSQQHYDNLHEDLEQGAAVDDACKGLWEGDGFAFVAETKAKTIQLRSRTIELLNKAASFDKLPVLRPYDKVLGALRQNLQVSAQTFDLATADEYCAGELTVQTLVGSSPIAPQPPPKVGMQQSMEDDTSAVRTQTQELCCQLEQQTAPTSAMETSSQDLASDTVRIADSACPASSDNMVESHAPSQASSSTSRPAQDKGAIPRKDASRKFHRAPSLQFKEDHDAESSVHARTSNRGSVTSRSSISSTAPKDALSKNASGRMSMAASPRLSVQGSPRSWKKSNTNSSMSAAEARKQESGKAGHLKNWIEKQVLYEDKRDVVIEAVDSGGDFRKDAVPAIVRILENKATGGIRLEVCLNRKQWTYSQVMGRSLELDEVTTFFTWGQQLRESIEARYKWMSDLVRLRVTGSLDLPLQELPVGDKECSRFRVMLGEYDAVDDLNQKCSGFKAFTSGFRERFHKSQEGVHTETEFNLRTGFNSRHPDMAERRKEVEIESVRKRYGIYENTSRALYEWYARLDSDGDGQIDEDEFSRFMCGIAKTYGQTMDAKQLQRHYNDMKTATNCVGFSQFVNFLFYKFPHVQEMTAFQVRRFAQKSTLRDCRAKRDSVVHVNKNMHFSEHAEEIEEEEFVEHAPQTHHTHFEEDSARHDHSHHGILKPRHTLMYESEDHETMVFGHATSTTSNREMPLVPKELGVTMTAGFRRLDTADGGVWQ